MKIFVGNISRDTIEEEINSLFEEFGEVTSVKLIRDGETKVLKGFGFVEMKNDAQAETAIKSLHGKNFKGRKLTVSEARPKNISL
jgi:RNA recognition motif-containing protein